MPNIKPYNPEIGTLRPTETGVEATAAAARRGGAFFNQAAQAKNEIAGATRQLASETRQLGEEEAASGRQTAHMAANAIKGVGGVIVDHAEHQEKMHGAAAEAALGDQITNAWNDTVKNADPNDPTVAQRFREQVLEPNLEKFGQSFLTEGGQKFAEARVERLRHHMFERTAADMGTLAAAAVTSNMRTITAARSNTAVTDPSAVPYLLGTIDADVADLVNSSPNLKGAAATKARIELSEKLSRQIAQAGAVGAIQKAADPEAEAAKWIAKYPDYISGTDALHLQNAARSQRNARQTDEERAIRLQERIRKEASEGRRDAILKDLHSEDAQKIGAITAKGIVNDRLLTVQDKEHLIGVVKRELKPETDAKVSAQTAVEIFKAIRDPNADPEKISGMIYDARQKDPGTPGSITKSDMADLQKQLLDIKTPQGAALAKDRDRFIKANAMLIDPQFDGSDLGKHSALGLQKMYDFETELHRQEEAARKAGVSPRLVYDRKSQYYVNPADYRASLQEINKYNATLKADDKARAAPPKVGERKEFKQGWGVWNGKSWAPEGAQ